MAGSRLRYYIMVFFVQTFFHRPFIDNFWIDTGYQINVIYDSCYQFLLAVLSQLVFYSCCICSRCMRGFIYLLCMYFLDSRWDPLSTGWVYWSSIIFKVAVLCSSIWFFSWQCYHNIWLDLDWDTILWFSLFRHLTVQFFWYRTPQVEWWWVHCGWFIVADCLLIYVYSWNMLMFLGYQTFVLEYIWHWILFSVLGGSNGFHDGFYAWSVMMSVLWQYSVDFVTTSWMCLLPFHI